MGCGGGLWELGSQPGHFPLLCVERPLAGVRRRALEAGSPAWRSERAPLTGSGGPRRGQREKCCVEMDFTLRALFTLALSLKADKVCRTGKVVGC